MDVRYLTNGNFRRLLRRSGSSVAVCGAFAIRFQLHGALRRHDFGFLIRPRSVNCLRHVPKNFYYEGRSFLGLRVKANVDVFSRANVIPLICGSLYGETNRQMFVSYVAVGAGVERRSKFVWRRFPSYSVLFIHDPRDERMFESDVYRLSPSLVVRFRRNRRYNANFDR